MKRRWIAFILLTLLPTQALALTASELQIVQYQASRYDPNASDSFCVGGPGGSGPLYGLHFPQVPDTGALANSIDTFIKNTEPGSPLNGMGNAFVSLGEKYDVNPALAIANAEKESQLGTTGHGPAPQNNDFGIRGSGEGGFKNFATQTDGITDYYQLLQSDYIGPPSNFTTVRQMMYKYAPPSDGNDTEGYISFIESVEQKILGGLTTGNATDTAALTAGCGSAQLTSAGALGWDLSGPHVMVSYDQGDPRWASDPYGAGKASIGSSGCGPTSIAMVVATLTGNSSVTPLTIANKYGGQYHPAGDGTSWAVFPVVGRDYGLQEQNLGTDLSSVPAILKQGGLVIISVGAGYFTSDGHIMVIRAVSADGTQFFLADPNGTGRHGDSETRGFTASFLIGEGHLKGLFAYTK